jgi:hypothetical protein
VPEDGDVIDGTQTVVGASPDRRRVRRRESRKLGRGCNVATIARQPPLRLRGPVITFALGVVAGLMIGVVIGVVVMAALVASRESPEDSP